MWTRSQPTPGVTVAGVATLSLVSPSSASTTTVTSPPLPPPPSTIHWVENEGNKQVGESDQIGGGGVLFSDPIYILSLLILSNSKFYVRYI